ncbi:GGDEF domain-containing response regulator [Alteromonadaceae bacterium BrNp21-10]|nr:GGDEF domain-containing response regulator [Alteromonadaceae bacterium BrNp21-10]
MRSMRVYILEDDEDDAYLVRQLLLKSQDSCHYDIKHFNTIADFEMEYEKTTPDVVLLDLGLQESRGLATLVNLLSVVNKCPIIVLTGLDDNDVGERAIQLGAQDFIPKEALSKKLLSRSIRFSKERFQLMKSIQNLGEHDELTLLNNRRVFDSELTSLLARHKRYGGKFAIMYLDLDGFKSVNDNYGHSVGDQLLRQLGSRLRNFSRATDIVARLGGDEFAIIVPQFENDDELEKIATDKVASIEAVYLVEVNQVLQEIYVGVSIGIAVYPLHGETTHALLDAADKAMYEAKAKKEISYNFADPSVLLKK